MNRDEDELLVDDGDWPAMVVEGEVSGLGVEVGVEVVGTADT